MWKRFLCSFVLAVLLCWSASAQAAWEYNADKDEWLNDEQTVKGTPDWYFERGLSLFEMKKYDAAHRSFKKITKDFSGSYLYEHAWFMMGESLYRGKKRYKAYKAYEECVLGFPDTEWSDIITVREFEIAQYFIRGGKRPALLFISLPDTELGKEIADKIVMRNRFNPLADDAYMEMGNYYADEGLYNTAIKQYDQVIRNYPTSEWVEEAVFRTAECHLEQSTGRHYNPAPLKEARARLVEYIRRFPDGTRRDHAIKLAGDITKKLARKGYEIGKYYQGQRKYDAALIYFEATVKEYPGTKWAKDAKKRIKKIRKKISKNKKD